MPDFKMGNPAKTIISQSGTANPTWGANAPTGCIVNVQQVVKKGGRNRKVFLARTRKFCTSVQARKGLHP